MKDERGSKRVGEDCRTRETCDTQTCERICIKNWQQSLNEKAEENAFDQSGQQTRSNDRSNLTGSGVG
jgi:hypothetical protein